MNDDPSYSSWIDSNFLLFQDPSLEDLLSSVDVDQLDARQEAELALKIQEKSVKSGILFNKWFFFALKSK